MRVVVANYQGGSDAAHLALLAEGIDHTVETLEGFFGYTRLLSRLWREGEGFVLLEHDIAPWFGAIHQLWDCEWQWCMFEYPKLGGRLTSGLGCAKFSDELVAGHPEFAEHWCGVSWHSLDGAVSTSIRQALHREHPERYPLCTHAPPLAHARRLD